MRISLVLCILGVSASLGITGCASLRPAAPIDASPLILQKPDEQLLTSRSGRYVFTVTRKSGEPSDHGTQGQFEWLEMRSSPEHARQLLLFIHPLGQSGPSLERHLKLGRAGFFFTQRRWLPDAVRVFDEQGISMSHEQQQAMLGRLIGSESSNINDAQFGALLASVMDIMQSAAAAPDASHHRVYHSDALTLSLRIAFDAAPIAGQSSDTPSR